MQEKEGSTQATSRTDQIRIRIRIMSSWAGVLPRRIKKKDQNGYRRPQKKLQLLFLTFFPVIAPPPPP